MTSLFVWFIAAASIAGVLFRPKNWPEAVWACSGAVLLVACGFLSPAQAGAAARNGTDVYLFLTGMMLLSELARREGVFDWLASLAVTAAQGSRTRLFTLVYLVGIAVTVFMSNDATAVVLTPAVYAAVRKARTQPLPYLLVCALIANAASFVLPISNPANLVVYGSLLPPLLAWLRTFLLPSVLSILATYVALRWVLRNELEGRIEDGSAPARLSREGRLAAWSIVGMAVILIAASAGGRDLGLPACIAGAIAVLITTRAHGPAIREIARGVSWSVLPLVAGLFVIVEALDLAGALADSAALLRRFAGLPRLPGALASAFGVAGLSNLMNNLPTGLLAGGALRTVHMGSYIRDAVLIGVDLGPNLTVTGSLATVLWLIALRRERQQIGAWQFFKTGLMVMPPALFLSTLAVAFLS